MLEDGFNIKATVKDGILTVSRRAAWTNSSYGQVYVAGSGTIEGKTISLILEHTFSAGSFGSGLHTIVLP